MDLSESGRISGHKQLKIKIMSSGKVLLGVLAGVAAGALIGILFAPDKGSETRKKIVEKGEDYVDGIKEKVGGLIDDLGKKVDGVKAKVDEMASAKTKTEEPKVSAN
jgi:gas vesicle protein